MQTHHTPHSACRLTTPLTLHPDSPHPQFACRLTTPLTLHPDSPHPSLCIQTHHTPHSACRLTTPLTLHPDSPHLSLCIQTHHTSHSASRLTTPPICIQAHHTSHSASRLTTPPICIQTHHSSHSASRLTTPLTLHADSPHPSLTLQGSGHTPYSLQRKLQHTKLYRSILPPLYLCTGNGHSPHYKGNALTCLRKAAADVSNIYTQALLAYTFTLAEDTETRQILLEKLEKQAVRKGEGRQLHWERPSTKPTSDLPYWYRAPSAEVELTSYMLMTRLSGPEKDLGRASEIVNWLSKQQNSNGGFSSTQDTVVALQSLGQYAGATFSDAGDVTVTVRSQTGVQEFHVDNTNRLLLQKASLPDIPGDYTLTAAGSGCVYVQVSAVLRYNIPPPSSDATFAISVEVISVQCDGESATKLQLQISVKYTGSREKSNMALIEVKMLSGFIPVKSSVKELEKGKLIQRSEIQTDMVTMYLDELGHESLDFTFAVEQDNEVKNLKPASAKIYDYYETGEFAVTEYNSPCGSGTTIPVFILL
uniref:Alpha-macroglobulin receptor-binding domain-containing protein n=1 Tax=Leptobrachium leishanense TaxID=445787 RepID=A0A8C5PP89_9ANUR